MKKVFILLLFLSEGLFNLVAEELPEDEFQVNFNSYFDNFNVSVIYPEVSVRKSIGESTSLNAKYLIDVITAASMRSHFDSVYSRQNVKEKIDAYTSATKSVQGGGDNFPDEVRHEIALGVTQLFDDITLSLNNLYSAEHDYYSETIAASVSIPFAMKNTVLNLGFVKSWDEVAPQTRKWTARKDVTTFTIGLTQIITPEFLTQAELFYSNLQGYLSDTYEVITVADFSNDYLAFFEPTSPDLRERYAVGLRSIYSLSEMSSILLGYRLYEDTWDIMSHTVNTLYQHQFLEEQLTFGAGIRAYLQSPACFLKATYTKPEEYMAVDPKLNGMTSLEFQFKLDVDGGIIPYIENEDIRLNASLNIFWRKTDTPDWHSRYYNLYASIFSMGIRYKF